MEGLVRYKHHCGGFWDKHLGIKTKYFGNSGILVFSSLGRVGSKENSTLGDFVKSPEYICWGYFFGKLVFGIESSS
jgi:hypothetical protein